MNNNLDLILIIVPVYNAEAYLKRCIESVLRQDYLNTEIILVNDGSIDNSLAICNDYSNKYPNKIHVIDQQNTGASIARKNGITIARGKYLLFVDSDDFVSKSYVSSLYNAVTEDNAGIAVCPFKIINPGGHIEDSNCLINSRVIPRKELFHRFFKYEFWGYGGGCYARHLFGNVNFPIATVNEDYFVKCQIFIAAKRVAYIDAPLYYYERHFDSLSKQPLSLRALGEFDNALATWEYVKIRSPEYNKQALAIASEAACKWLGTINNSNPKNPEIVLYKNKIKQFINTNMLSILLNSSLLWKIKIVLLLNYTKSLKNQQLIIC